jgi:hypothetical protein
MGDLITCVSSLRCRHVNEAETWQPVVLSFFCVGANQRVYIHVSHDFSERDRRMKKTKIVQV